MKEKLDVAILGGGLAGLTLARQLRLNNKSLKIAIFEKKEVIDDWKVGEATVEISSNYFCRRLNLTNYLYRSHLPKNGLRYFFDSEKKDLKIEEMSEIGTSGFPEHPSFLIDRIVFERDLIKMNEDDGIKVFLGHTISEFQEGEDKHTFKSISTEKKEERFESKWVIDATGRGKFLHKKIGVKTTRENRLNTSAVWGRFSNLKDIDKDGDPKWKDRVNHSPRMMATMHFMYEGYWIWVIPVDEEVFSIGVVFDKDIVKEKINVKNFFEFLKKHKSLQDMLVDSEMLDCKGYGHIPYYADQYFFKNRLAVTGEAGAFTDPFYSPGSDFIAISNDIIAKLIELDLNSEDHLFDTSVEMYNEFYQDRYERTIRLYSDNYKYFGCFNLLSKKYFLDLCHYYNLYLWSYMNDHHLEPKYIKKFLLERSIADKINQWQETLLEELYSYFKNNNLIGAQNKGEFNNVSRSTSRIFDLLIHPYCEKRGQEFLRETLVMIWLEALDEVYHSNLKDEKLLMDSLSIPFILKQKNPLSEETFNKLLSKSSKRAIAGELKNVEFNKVMPGAH